MRVGVDNHKVTGGRGGEVQFCSIFVVTLKLCTTFLALRALHFVASSARTVFSFNYLGMFGGDVTAFPSGSSLSSNSTVK